MPNREQKLLLCLCDEIEQCIYPGHYRDQGHRDFRTVLPGQPPPRDFVPDLILVSKRCGPDGTAMPDERFLSGARDIPVAPLPPLFTTYPAPAPASAFRNASRREAEQCPLTIELELTAHCNTGCPICPRGALLRRDHEMDAELLDRIIDHCVRLRPDLVWLCGIGEPLLHPKVTEVVRRLSDSGCPVGINTNGELLTDAVFLELLDAGLDRITISISGFHKETYRRHMGRLDYETVWENTRSALERRPEIVSLNTVVTQDNYKETPDLLSHWHRQGARSLKLTQWSNKSGNLPMKQDLYYGDIQALITIIAGLKLKALTAINDFALHGLQPPDGFHCTAPLGVMFVDVMGRILHCQHDVAGIDVKGSFTDCSETELRQLRMRSYLNPSLLCRDCNASQFDHAHYLWGDREIVFA